jgi:hypothetical protein
LTVKSWTEVSAAIADRRTSEQITGRELLLLLLLRRRGTMAPCGKMPPDFITEEGATRGRAVAAECNAKPLKVLCCA